MYVEMKLYCMNEATAFPFQTFSHRLHEKTLEHK